MQASTIPIGISLIILVFLYLVFFRPWQLRWGATDAEVNRSMPGDEIVSQPSFNATRAVTIHASAQNIYPWIVQMGVTRAGTAMTCWITLAGGAQKASCSTCSPNSSTS